MAPTSARKSTNVRRLFLLRLGISAAEYLAPDRAARVLTRLWFQPPGHRTAPAPAGAREFHLDTAAGRVWGYDWGDGPLVHLLHGWGGCSGDMRYLAASLVAAGRRVVVIDAPGHGHSEDSPYGPGQVSPLHFADALTATVEKFGTGAVAAHSLGCLGAALSLRHHVSADRLVLVSPFIGGGEFIGMFARRLGAGRRGSARFVAAAEARSGHPVAYFDVRTPPDPTPTLIVHDRDDRATPFAHGEAIAAAWPNTRLHATSGLGHLRIMRNPEVVGEVVGFLTG
ncbi:serine aminopeptidase S33 family [Stackebrandtia albiflava]|uniref:Serine aminopeptidase S33 family n=1 Tax=Stackebrandtia albiflava TaxID=406432 RepID=A0A562URY1_9ACTN|nr:alpha/beta fold hydrolase [Stackebrandtia albiflava]TWJ08369.1 serine aminopeptidase S33 family [Stackebrandtia albiflava]